MTKAAGVHEAKAHLSRLLQLVEQGEEVEITVAARWWRVWSRPGGQVGESSASREGQFTVPDDFDAPLPDDVLRSVGGA